MKLKSLKVFQSVKTGLGEKTFLTNEDFTITLDTNTGLITIKDDKQTTLTSVSNMAWSWPKETKKDEPTKGPKSSKGTTKKEKPKAKLGNKRISKAK